MRGSDASLRLVSRPLRIAHMNLKSARAAASLSSDFLRATNPLFASCMEGRRSSSASAASLTRTWSPQHGIRFNAGPPPAGTDSANTEQSTTQRVTRSSSRPHTGQQLPPEKSVLDKTSKAESLDVDVEEVTKKVEKVTLAARTDKAEEETERARFRPPSFLIPESTLKEAQEAIEKEEERFWSYNMYRGPEDKPPQLWYCHSKWQTERVCRDHFLNEKVLGFDIEWVNDRWGPRKISVIQLASASDIGIFHLARHGGRTAFEIIAPTLKAIIESEAIIKTGVNIAADRTHLAKFLRLQGTSIIDLGQLYNLVHRITSPPGTRRVLKRTRALQKLTTEFLHLPMRKDMAIRTGDWTRRMERNELVYCADDAYAGFHLFHVLNAKRVSMAPILPLPPSAELGLDFFLPAETEPESSEEESGDELDLELDEDASVEISPDEEAGPAKSSDDSDYIR